MRVIYPYLTARMTRHSFAGIEGKGTTQAADLLKEYLKDKDGTKFYLQEDVCKFYPTMNQDVAVSMFSRVFKDEKVLRLLDKMFHHTPAGLQIGFYISQLTANYLYTIVDRVITEKMGAKYYVRFCDDMVVLSDDRYFLKRVHESIKDAVENIFHQHIHEDYVLSRVGYEFKYDTRRRKRKRGSKGKKYRLSRLSVQS
jgi:Reverse transcriptase (RNA-dependent DNA polymerase).